MTLKHDDLVRYIGRTQRDLGLIHGQTYRNFGVYPQPPMTGWVDRDEVCVRVDDTDDSFGGVISRPAKDFERVESD